MARFCPAASSIHGCLVSAQNYVPCAQDPACGIFDRVFDPLQHLGFELQGPEINNARN
jgi:hypothetical protein